MYSKLYLIRKQTSTRVLYEFYVKEIFRLWKISYFQKRTKNVIKIPGNRRALKYNLFPKPLFTMFSKVLAFKNHVIVKRVYRYKL